jgi:hypothetical protein
MGIWMRASPVRGGDRGDARGQGGWGRVRTMRSGVRGRGEEEEEVADEEDEAKEGARA